MENEIIEGECTVISIDPIWPKYSGKTISLDVIGTLYVDDAPLAGYHVNATRPVAEWAHLEVTPTSPTRVFGGCETHFYVFASEEEFLSSPADLDAQ